MAGCAAQAQVDTLAATTISTDTAQSIWSDYGGHVFQYVTDWKTIREVGNSADWTIDSVSAGKIYARYENFVDIIILHNSKF